MKKNSMSPGRPRVCIIGAQYLYGAGGGQVSEQTRIEWMQQKISTASEMAMQEHKRLLKSFGKQDPELETDCMVQVF